MRRILMAVVAGGLLIGLFAATGCTDGGGGLSLEEYFQRLEKLDRDADERSGTVEAELGDPEDVEAVQDAFVEFLAIIETFVDDLAGLEPPSEVEDLHSEAVEAGRAFQQEFERIASESEDAQTLEELEAFFDDEAVAAADQRFTDACLDLQQIAADNNIEADLNCEDEGGGEEEPGTPVPTVTQES